MVHSRVAACTRIGERLVLPGAALLDQRVCQPGTAKHHRERAHLATRHHPFRRARERNNLMPASERDVDDTPSDETSRAGDAEEHGEKLKVES